MTVDEFDKTFYSIFCSKYEMLDNIPSHIEFYINKIKKIQQFTNYGLNIFDNKEILILDTILSKFKNKKILDIGCGIGTLSIFLKINGVDVEACDVWKERAEDFKYFCNQLDTNINIHEKPYQVLDLNSFDVLVAVNIPSTVNDFKKDIKLLTELNNNGKHIYIEPHSYESSRSSSIAKCKTIYYDFCNTLQEKFFL